MKAVNSTVLRHASLAPALVLASVLLLGGCFTLTRPALPQVRGSTAVEGLNDRVEIHRDAAGVAHIIATNDADVFFGQGHVHAQDRFYQMEFWRRVGAGRLSELYGEEVLATDIYLRTMGFRHVAQQEYEAAPALQRLALESYAAGVNAYIAERKPRKLAAEFAFLGLQGVKPEIEPWTPLDTLTWPKVMSQDLAGDWVQELLRLDVIRAVGVDMARDFFAPFRYGEMPTVIHAQDLDGEGARHTADGRAQGNLSRFDCPAWLGAVAGLQLDSPLIQGRQLLADVAFGGSMESGSNQWVVSGDHTASGLPQLANDPHLGIQMPSIWYKVSLHVTGADAWNCQGYSFAGVPGIVIGHNDHIVWGMSSAEPDVQDLYVERINPHNRDEYLVGDRWVPMEIRHEVIRVKGAEPYFLRVRSTRNGPIVTDHGGAVPYSSYDVRPIEIIPTDLILTELSLRWTALEPGTTHYAVLLYNRARTFDQFRRALSYFDTPSHNFLYADVFGNIGYVHPGRLPLRGQGTGSLPLPGWDDTYQWQGYIDYDQLPWLLNPERGYIISANNPVSAHGSLPFSEHLYNPGFRASRAEELLTAAMADGPLTKDHHVAMQLDVRNEFAARILPHVLAVDRTTIHRSVAAETRLLSRPADTPAKRAELQETIEKRIAGALTAREMLADWDLLMETDSVGATVFAQFYVELCRKTFADQLPPHVWNGPWDTAYGYRMQNSLWLLVEDPENQWWDDVRTPDRRETRDEILARALASAYEQLEERFGKRTERWTWGRAHTATFRNATLGRSGIRFVERIFNRGPVPVAGGLDVLRRADFRVLQPFEVHHIASMRMIVDTADWSSARYVHGPGQSGHPASRHYADMVRPWAEGSYLTHPWTVEEVYDQSRRLLVLEPVR